MRRASCEAHVAQIRTTRELVSGFYGCKVKNIVYQDRPTTRDDMKQRIRETFQSLDHAEVLGVADSVGRRVRVSYTILECSIFSIQGLVITYLTSKHNYNIPISITEHMRVRSEDDSASTTYENYIVVYCNASNSINDDEKDEKWFRQKISWNEYSSSFQLKFAYLCRNFFVALCPLVLGLAATVVGGRNIDGIYSLPTVIKLYAPPRYGHCSVVARDRVDSSYIQSHVEICVVCIKINKRMRSVYE
ncbi:hypothetical protein ANN_14378 [Periplaneta americana]|uniref:Uncharacterized protein n=1 Tax=Periplaneta americana TaxID=6978 RepID=A0ABQ8SW54_PERAM|nr:hypothetical protein ANN_14378 [Periplaneta americana]